MAWISVHDHVDGKKLRRLSKMLDCSKAEALGVLNFLWFWGLNNADENGRIEDADKGDVAEVFYGKTEIPPEKVVSALFSSGWLDDVGGIIYLHDWSEWQEQWYKFRRKRDYGATTTNVDQMEWAADSIGNLPKSCNTFLSIEPLVEDITCSIGWLSSMIQSSVPYFKWIIIGAMTGPGSESRQPCREWVEKIVEDAKNELSPFYPIPVFMKDNLRKVWGRDLIQEFPEKLEAQG